VGLEANHHRQNQGQDQAGHGFPYPQEEVPGEVEGRNQGGKEPGTGKPKVLLEKGEGLGQDLAKVAKLLGQKGSYLVKPEG